MGKRDPLWGVATWPGRERGGANPWTDDEFYALGSDWLGYQDRWQSSIGFHPGTVLEVGCGAGRITQMLAREFAQVLAVDVSQDAIDYARSRVLGSNIDWRVGDGDAIPATDDSVDAVFSCHVFQHFPDNATQLAVFSEVFRVLKPGGTFSVHIPMYQFPAGRLGAALRKAYSLLVSVRPAPKMYMTAYEIDRLIDDVGAIGFKNVCISVLPNHIVYGRKPTN